MAGIGSLSFGLAFFTSALIGLASGQHPLSNITFIGAWSYTAAQTDFSVTIRFGVFGDPPLPPLFNISGLQLLYMSDTDQFSVPLVPLSIDLSVGLFEYNVIVPELFGRTTGSLAITSVPSPGMMVDSIDQIVDFVYWGQPQNHSLINLVEGVHWDNASQPIDFMLTGALSAYDLDPFNGLGNVQSASAYREVIFPSTPVITSHCDQFANSITAGDEGYSSCEIPLANFQLGCQDIRNTGQMLSLGDDQGMQVTLPFEFEFFGSIYNSASLGSNGFLDFVNQAISPALDCPFLNDGDPAPIFAMLWNDWNPVDGGTIHIDTRMGPFGVPVFIIQFSDIPRFADTTTTASFVATLEQYTNALSVCFLGTEPSGAIGVRSALQTGATEGNCGSGTNSQTAYIFETTATQVGRGSGDTGPDTTSTAGIAIGVFVGFAILVVICVVCGLIFGRRRRNRGVNYWGFFGGSNSNSVNLRERHTNNSGRRSHSRSSSRGRSSSPPRNSNPIAPEPTLSYANPESGPAVSSQTAPNPYAAASQGPHPDLPPSYNEAHSPPPYTGPQQAFQAPPPHGYPQQGFPQQGGFPSHY